MIPKDWKRGLMGEVIKLISGQHIEAQFYNEDKIGIPYLTGPSDFQDGKINITKYTEQPKVLCESGDILITVKGSGTGKSIIANQKCCIGRQLMAVRATKIDRTFAFYIIQSREAKYGDTASGLIPGIAREHILETSLLIPPLLEQCRIAEVLGVWDESIDLLERLIGRVRSRKQGLMQQLLTGKKRFKEFEGSEWKTVTFEDVLLIEIGGTPSRANADCWDNEKSTLNYWLSIADLKGKYITKTKEYITELGIKKSNAKLFPAGTVVMSFKLTIGKVAILRNPMYTNEAICSLIPKYANSIDTEFLYQVIGIVDFDKEIDQAIKGKTLNKEKIKRLILKLPSLPEQEKIAAVLSAADEEISTLEKQLAAYKQQKLGLMQQLLTGSIRI
jgi:type I restriction enzyme, S subunit